MRSITIAITACVLLTGCTKGVTKDSFHQKVETLKRELSHPTSKSVRTLPPPKEAEVTLGTPSGSVQVFKPAGRKPGNVPSYYVTISLQHGPIEEWRIIVLDPDGSCNVRSSVPCEWLSRNEWADLFEQSVAAAKDGSAISF